LTLITAYAPIFTNPPLYNPPRAEMTMEITGCAASVNRPLVYMSSSAVSLQGQCRGLRNIDLT